MTLAVTGRTLTALTLHYAVQGWGVDVSAEMLEVARAQVPEHVHLQQATAENLPFPDCYFERVCMTMVVHLLNRRAAFSETWRVLQPGGRMTIMTPDPATFASTWIAPFFPSYIEIEQGRFPANETLAEEVTSAGFTRHSCVYFSSSYSFSKEMALRKLRERHISTFVLLDEDEFRAGLAQRPRDLPDPVESVQSSFFISAERN